MNVKKKNGFVLRDKLARWSKITLGIIISILAAELAQVEFAPSTGVVAMLGIQGTKKDTLKTAAKRIISFVYTVGIAILVHEYIGTEIFEFSLVIMIMVLVTVMLGWEDTLSINVVIAVHLFIQSEPFTQALVFNETKRVIIGVVTAIVVNRNKGIKTKVFSKYISALEDELKKIMSLYEVFFNGQSNTDEIDTELEIYNNMIQNISQKAYIHAGNKILQHSKYYEKYMKMRDEEYINLRHIDSLARSLSVRPQEAEVLGNCINSMINCIAVSENTEGWKKSINDFKERLENIGAPMDYTDMEDRAALIFIAKELTEIIDKREEFVVSLTDAQKKIYLKGRNLNQEGN